jgi:hypothetical protein
MTKTFFPGNAALMSPRTAKYVEAMVREGFDYYEWLKEIREEEAQAKQAEATGTSGELVAAQIVDPIKTSDGQHRLNPLLRLATKTTRVPRALRLHHQPKSKTPNARLRRRLERVRRACEHFQSSRKRDAVYGYLEPVFAIVMHYKVRRRTARLLRHAYKFADRPLDKNADAFSTVIACTCDSSVDAKTMSKYARALRYVACSKKPDSRLRTFMKESGGINACASLYAKQLGRNSRVAAI